MDGRTWTIEGTDHEGKSLGCLVRICVEVSPSIDEGKVEYLYDLIEKLMRKEVYPTILETDTVTLPGKQEARA